jgi:hypothetical protein
MPVGERRGTASQAYTRSSLIVLHDSLAVCPNPQSWRSVLADMSNRTHRPVFLCFERPYFNSFQLAGRLGVRSPRCRESRVSALDDRRMVGQAGLDTYSTRDLGTSGVPNGRKLQATPCVSFHAATPSITQPPVPARCAACSPASWSGHGSAELINQDDEMNANLRRHRFGLGDETLASGNAWRALRLAARERRRIRRNFRPQAGPCQPVPSAQPRLAVGLAWGDEAKRPACCPRTGRTRPRRKACYACSRPFVLHWSSFTAFRRSACPFEKPRITSPVLPHAVQSHDDFPPARGVLPTTVDRHAKRATDVPPCVDLSRVGCRENAVEVHFLRLMGGASRHPI